MSILDDLFPPFLQYGEDAADSAQAILEDANELESLVLDLGVAALTGPTSAAAELPIRTIEPGPDPDSVSEFGVDILQRASRLPPISLFDLTRDNKGDFDKFEVRQGYLLNCPLPAVLTALAHVDENRSARNRRLPRIIRSEFRPMRPITTRRPTLLDEELAFLAAEKAAGRDTKIARSFRSDVLFHCSFFARKQAIVTSNVLFWQQDWGRLLYAWSTTGALWPSAIEKCYTYEIRRSRNYSSLAQLTSQRLEGLESAGLSKQPVFDHAALSSIRAELQDKLPAYQNIGDLPGLLVMIDLVGPSNEFAVDELSNDDLGILLRRHRHHVTILGVKAETELAPNDPTPLSLTANHYLAVIGFDPQTMQTTVIDALGAGPDLKGDDVRSISLATLRHDVGELVQEL